MFSIVLSSALLFTAPDARPVALVLKVGGAVTLQRGEKKDRLAAGAKLLPGDRLAVPGSGTVALIYYGDGHRERVKPDQTAMVGKERCTPPSAIEVPKAAHALAARNLDKIKEIQVGEGAGVGVPRDWPPQVETTRSTPMFGTRVVSGRPAFSWPAVKDAATYKVEVFRSTGVHDETLRLFVQLAYRGHHGPARLNRQGHPVLAVSQCSAGRGNRQAAKPQAAEGPVALAARVVQWDLQFSFTRHAFLVDLFPLSRAGRRPCPLPPSSVPTAASPDG